MTKKQLLDVKLYVDQPTINAYADLTADTNPLHTDPVFAATTPMGGVIAHGTLSLNLIWASVVRSLGVAALTGAELSVRFAKPVRVGETVTAGGEEGDKPGQYQVWVRGPDGTAVIEGTVDLSLPGHPSDRAGA